MQTLLSSRARTVLLAAVLLAGGCSPALNWREWRPEGAAIQALFPCKPSGPTRRVPLAGAEVAMTLVACDADGSTFVLGHADVGDPARVGPALDALAAGAAGNVGATLDGVPTQPIAVPGATPHRESRRLRLAGRRPDGSAIEVHVAVFSHATTVYQAAVIGGRPGTEAVEMFFAGLKLGG